MSAEDPTVDFDYDALLADIEREVEAKRDEGAYPPAFDDDLDELFSRFAPSAAADDFEGLVADAERSGAIEATIPVASQRRGGTVVKQTLARGLTWYHAILAEQLTQFTAAVTGSLRALGNRTDQLRARTDELEAMFTAALRAPEGGAVVPAAAAAGLASLTAAALAGTDGRVLVAESGDGAILTALVEAGLDAYGVEPSRAQAAASVEAGLDVQPDDAWQHLDRVASGRLGALVLAGVIERRAPGEQVEMLDLALSRLNGRGRLVIASHGQTAARLADPVGTDLAAGAPFHPRTWQHLLTERGWECDVRVTRPLVEPESGSGATSDSIERIAEILGPEAYVLVAVPR